ncbi:MAG TPA: hypothetical protein VE617_10535 [Propionibacteriaceae bacterium]|nr:hypothetical protein [Propionibacteriaceae bacterium]
MHLLLITPEGQVHRIAEQTIAGPGTPDEVARHVDPGQDAVQSRQHQVGDDHPERDQQQRLPAEADSQVEEQVGKPYCRDTREREKRAVNLLQQRGPPFHAPPRG